MRPPHRSVSFFAASDSSDGAKNHASPAPLVTDRLIDSLFATVDNFLRDIFLDLRGAVFYLNVESQLCHHDLCISAGKTRRAVGLWHADG